jgi:hypothetical protein
MRKWKKFVATLAAATVAAPFLSTAAAYASTQTVRFQAGGWHCPKGVYDVVGVDVMGTNVSTLNMHGTWRGSASTPTVTVVGVPTGGGQAQVTVTYRCKTGNWWAPASQAEPAYGTRWIYGTPPQPLYTL